MEQALSDMKVLDLTWYIAGPYCTKLLADYGADVIKVEPTGEGDPARRMGPFLNDEPHLEKSGLFLDLNTNKKSITLNLKSEWGRRAIRDLVKDVDILVENFRPGVMEGFGLDYKTLEAINPRLVMTSISNFGQTGPYRDFRASEIVIYGMGGAMFCNGLPEKAPLKKALTATLFQGGVMAANATMMAYLLAQETGEGQWVDVSLMETQLGAVDRRMAQLLTFQWNKTVTYREDPKGRQVYPMGIHRCKDGFFECIGIGVNWPSVGRMMDMPELVDDPRFSNVFAQMQPGNKEAFEVLWIPWCLEHTKAEIIEKGQKAGVLCGPLASMEEVVADPHWNARGFFAEIDHPVAGKLTYPGRPIKADDMPWVIRTPAPLLGQDNDEVYGKLGYSKEHLATLRATGII